ncbi:hypothetical protein GOBAR_AA37092 [Gossypium barbadense]|uniref:Uncharacterized protein n=1 Tax=Gossypium barbadense TaxID=3634 RepID=A0A2P5VXQ5_GOSBA|nr:hypothetical protein GOBAR_AA37092 [Gossypium barbadense]
MAQGKAAYGGWWPKDVEKRSGGGGRRRKGTGRGYRERGEVVRVKVADEVKGKKGNVGSRGHLYRRERERGRGESWEKEG